MNCVDIGSVEIGMVLAQPVYNHQGDLMLPAGRSMSEKDLRVLKSWGIEKVWVRKEVQESVAVNEKDLGGKKHEVRCIGTLEDKFGDVLDDAVMAEILRVAKKIQERRQTKPTWDDDNRKSIKHY